MRWPAWVALFLGLSAAAACPAQTVSLSGTLGTKALLVIDGKPQTIGVGQVAHGVKLISLNGEQAVVEVTGQRRTLSLGGAQVNLGSNGPGAGTLIVLKAGTGGHFIANGSINGQAVSFLVDTGATFVALGAAQAQRLGIDYLHGEPGVSNTANGQIGVYRVSLASVRLGDVQVYDVAAVVVQQPMEHILLGNSFLTRFEMTRANDTMTLTRRY